MKLPNKDFWNGKKVFITGAQGFKGVWLTTWLMKLGANVLRDFGCDICDQRKLSFILNKFQPEIVFHLAAVSTVYDAFLDPINAMNVNVVGTTTLLNVLRQVQGIKAIINITTDKVYHVEGIDRGYVETDLLGGLEPYAISKVCSEHISTVYQKTYKMPIVTVRAGNVIGGGDFKASRLIPNYYTAFRDNMPLEVNTDAVRPWQYILDALCGYLLLAEKLYGNISYVGAWNFSSNEYESRTVQWIVDELNKYFNPKVDYALVDARGFYETKNLKLCSDKAQKALDWTPKYDMEEMVRRTAGWYLGYYQKKDVTNIYQREIEEYS